MLAPDHPSGSRPVHLAARSRDDYLERRRVISPPLRAVAVARRPGGGVVTLPNFIVIGAAKAGTTALYWYLAEHPAVFMSPVKETNFFAYNLDDAGRLLYGDPDVHRFPV